MLFHDDDGKPYEIAMPLSCGHCETEDSRRIHLLTLFRTFDDDPIEFKTQPTACLECAIPWVLVNATPSNGFVVLTSSGISHDWCYSEAADWLSFDKFSRALDGPRLN
jgi:hypothetical protein